jgi:DNA polymerase-3 subunit chi
MACVDFSFGTSDRLRSACQLLHKHYLAGQRIVVYCSDGTRLAAFDRMLWTFDDTSFVPHVLASSSLAVETPVVLTASEPQAAAALIAMESPAPWLLNLDDQCPPGYQRFDRLLEVVSNDPADRQAARQRWRHYAAEGYTVQSHDLAAQPP